MATVEKSPATQDQADLVEVCRLAAEGRKVTDPDLLTRIISSHTHSGSRRSSSVCLQIRKSNCLSRNGRPPNDAPAELLGRFDA